jgi:hypothetical protein
MATTKRQLQTTGLKTDPETSSGGRIYLRMYPCVYASVSPLLSCLAAFFFAVVSAVVFARHAELVSASAVKRLTA